ncbi:MAG: hypothetical protein MZW92_33550 [Comamonadaceae bacterium]|nr:hypothetical protein [Comamonadaceae bacterium]
MRRLQGRRAGDCRPAGARDAALGYSLAPGSLALRASRSDEPTADRTATPLRTGRRRRCRRQPRRRRGPRPLRGDRVRRAGRRAARRARCQAGVQNDLGLPPPAVAVSGGDALLLWFSLQQPADAARARAARRPAPALAGRRAGAPAARLAGRAARGRAAAAGAPGRRRTLVGLRRAGSRAAVRRDAVARVPARRRRAGDAARRTGVDLPGGADAALAELAPAAAAPPPAAVRCADCDAADRAAAFPERRPGPDRRAARAARLPARGDERRTRAAGASRRRGEGAAGARDAQRWLTRADRLAPPSTVVRAKAGTQARTGARPFGRRRTGCPLRGHDGNAPRRDVAALRGARLGGPGHDAPAGRAAAIQRRQSRPR